MLLPKNATVAVANGEKLALFRNAGNEREMKLVAMPLPEIDTSNRSGGVRHQSSPGNPNDSQVEEDGFAAGVAGALNKQALTNKLTNVVVIAAPRTLGELRKHYHKELQSNLLAEVPKDLTGHPIPDIEKALMAT